MTFRDTQNMFNRITKSKKSQHNRQKFIRQAIALAFILQAIIIGVKGNLDVLSGKPSIEVIQWMMFQGIELIVKLDRTQKNTN
ncbi:MAG: hypothetical protein HC849_13730 [Oscillatoriales cyanobacterium RU_3_3]|nr:hypothetical protein [Oscillatoriales cyanobacterium RU_3_3]